MASMWSINISRDEWTQVGENAAGEDVFLIFSCDLDFAFIAIADGRVPSNDFKAIRQPAGNIIRVSTATYGNPSTFDRFYMKLISSKVNEFPATVWVSNGTVNIDTDATDLSEASP